MSTLNRGSVHSGFIVRLDTLWVILSTLNVQNRLLNSLLLVGFVSRKGLENDVLVAVVLPLMDYDFADINEFLQYSADSPFVAMHVRRKLGLRWRAKGSVRIFLKMPAKLEHGAYKGGVFVIGVGMIGRWEFRSRHE